MVSTVACWASGLAQAARLPAARSTKMADRMTTPLFQFEARGETAVLLATNRDTTRRRRMVEALVDQTVGIGRRHAVGKRRAQLGAGRLDEVRRDDDHQFGLRTLESIGLEQRAEDGNVAEPGQ